LEPVAPTPDAAGEIARKFFAYLEANADDYWNVPHLELEGAAADEEEDDEEESLYGAAYADMTYQDSTDDDVEGEVLEGGPQRDFNLEFEAERLEQRLRFLATLARLWTVATHLPVDGDESRAREMQLAAGSWLTDARRNYHALLALLDAVHNHPIPEPLGSYDSLVEFDRRRGLKERLLGTVLETCLDTALAAGALQSRVSEQRGEAPPARRPKWEPLLIDLEQALRAGDAAAAQGLLPRFVHWFRREPLLYTPLSDGGEPRQILRARIAQTILRTLVASLPRLGLLREAYHLVKTARAMEIEQPRQEGVPTSEFAHIFGEGCEAVIEAVIDSAAGEWDDTLVNLLDQVVVPFLHLWREYSQSLRLSSLEAVAEEDWPAIAEFIRRYGSDLFTVRFLDPANVRAVLTNGVGAYLDYLRDHGDPLQPVQLIEDLGQGIPRADAERFLEAILKAVLENHEEFKDYHQTAAQAAYGENLYLLLDFLRLKASYERQAWHLRPLLLAHDALARQGQLGAALLWQKNIEALVQDVARHHLDELARLEKTHGLHLRTVSDRVQERFVKPLQLDRLCALIEPAMEEAGQPGAGMAFAQLEEEIRAYAATPTGVGLDVPHWLRRLEAEVQRVRTAQTEIANLAEHLLQVPILRLPLEDLQAQLQIWDQPLDSA
jgi:hypothetical protein